MHTANLLSVALASAMLAGRAATQVWQPLPATAHPPIAGALAMAHDPLRQRTICCADEVMFSGPGWAQGRTSTWEWDGTRWLPAPTATTPTPTAAAHALAGAWTATLRLQIGD